MKQSVYPGGYSPVFISVFSKMTRLWNLVSKTKQTAALKRMMKKTENQANKRSFEAFARLIPLLNEYDHSQALYHLHIYALQIDCPDLESCYQKVNTHPELVAHLKENLTFVGSHFFRGGMWTLLQEQCSVSMSGKEHIKIWCAGCSSGKEVYSVLMLLSDCFPEKEIEMLATDYNMEVLQKCREGIYPLGTIEEIPVQYRLFLERYVRPRGEKNCPKVDFSHRFQFRVSARLRRLVTTQHLDLLSDVYPSEFDLILCRNVIKFFEVPVRHQVQRRLAGSLKPGGLLVVSDKLEFEGISDPESLQLHQIDGSCIYRKDSQDKQQRC